MKGGNQAEIVEHCRAQFAGEPMQRVHRFFHEPSCPRDSLLEGPGLNPRLPGQGQEIEINTNQGLGHLIMELAADALSLLLLRPQHQVGQMPQLFLHLPRLLQQSRNLRRARGDPLFQLRVEFADFLPRTFELGYIGERSPIMWLLA